MKEAHRKRLGWAGVVAGLTLLMAGAVAAHFTGLPETDSLGREKTVESAAAPKIQNRLAGFQRRDSQRVATSETEVRPLRHRRQFGLAVTELSRNCILPTAPYRLTASGYLRL